MMALRVAAALTVCCAAISLPGVAYGQSQSAHALVWHVVQNELAADAHDHSRWMYRDHNKLSGSDTVKLVLQTPHGTLSKTIEENGRPLTASERQADEQKMHQFVTDASVRQKQKKDAEHDDAQAASLTKMLPNAFLWTVTGKNGAETSLSFKPNPKFVPPTREARVFAAMEGTMVVNTKQKRIKSLKGTLMKDVDFGWGLLGKLQKGGTFNVERQQVGPRVWEITATHIHIQGHALIFKSISEQQDEETSNYKPAPRSITLENAAKMLNDGQVAKEIGVAQPQ